MCQHNVSVGFSYVVLVFSPQVKSHASYLEMAEAKFCILFIELLFAENIRQYIVAKLFYVC